MQGWYFIASETAHKTSHWIHTDSKSRNYVRKWNTCCTPKLISIEVRTLKENGLQQYEETFISDFLSHANT